MVLMASMMLPGASFVASAKDKSKRDRANKRDKKVQPAPDSAKARMRKQTYRVGDLLKEIKSTGATLEKSARSCW